MHFRHYELCYRPSTLGKVRAQVRSRERAVPHLLGLLHWRGEPQCCLVREFTTEVGRSGVRFPSL